MVMRWEDGESETEVISGDVSKPISIVATKASDWWKIQEYKFGIQLNIGDGGFAISLNLIEVSATFSKDNESLEFLLGLNKIGFTKSTDVNFGNRTAGHYDHMYVRTIPLLAIGVISYGALKFIGSKLAAIGAVGALISIG